MSTPDRFGPIVSRWPIVTAWRDEIEAWAPEYLAAYERQSDLLPVGSTARPISCIARHAGVVKSGERTPAIIVWPRGVTNHTVDPEGVVTGDLELGLLIVAGAKDLDSTADVLHRIAAAVMAMLHDRTTVAGHAADLWLVDEDYEGVDHARERYLASVELSYVATGVDLGTRRDGPPRDADPRRDPTRPWPPSPAAEAAHVELQPEPIHDPEDV